MDKLLSALFDFFKLKSPKVFAVFVAVIGVILVLDQQTIISLPEWVKTLLMGIGLVTGTSTPGSKKD